MMFLPKLAECCHSCRDNNDVRPRDPGPTGSLGKVVKAKECKKGCGELRFLIAEYGERYADRILRDIDVQ